MNTGLNIRLAMNRALLNCLQKAMTYDVFTSKCIQLVSDSALKNLLLKRLAKEDKQNECQNETVDKIPKGALKVLSEHKPLYFIENLEGGQIWQELREDGKQ